MKWMAVVILTVLSSIYTGPDRYELPISITAGRGLLWIVLRIANFFREKLPRAAKVTAHVLLIICSLISLYMLA
jgi:hypothetical protein